MGVSRRSLRLAAVVLAAGAGSRFAPPQVNKLLAELDGKPVLGHVLAAIRDFGPAETVVVLGHGADEIEHACHWAGEVRVRNHAPDRGLASSLQLGIDTLRALPGWFDGAFVVLGDQPCLSADVLLALAMAAASQRPADRLFVVPRYEDGRGPRDATPEPRDAASGPRNPVLLLRPAWSFVDDLEGDRGLAPLIAQRPDQVLEVAVPGSMPDVDRPEDLDALRRACDVP